MYTALYYPHIKIKNVNIIKTGLLLWDNLECICPSVNKKPKYPDKDVAEAWEIIGKLHIPSDEEKQLAHKAIEEIVRLDFPEWSFARSENPAGLRYDILPEKFLHESWKLLQNSMLVRPNIRFGFEYYEMHDLVV